MRASLLCLVLAMLGPAIIASAASYRSDAGFSFDVPSGFEKLPPAAIEKFQAAADAFVRQTSGNPAPRIEAGFQLSGATELTAPLFYFTAAPVPENTSAEAIETSILSALAQQTTPARIDKKTMKIETISPEGFDVKNGNRLFLVAAVGRERMVSFQCYAREGNLAADREVFHGILQSIAFAPGHEWISPTAPALRAAPMSQAAASKIAENAGLVSAISFLFAFIAVYWGGSAMARRSKSLSIPLFGSRPEDVLIPRFRKMKAWVRAAVVVAAVLSGRFVGDTLGTVYADTITHQRKSVH